MTNLLLRLARAEDAAALATIHRNGRAAIPLTNELHSFEDVVGYHAHLIADTHVLVAVDANDTPLGYAAREGGVLAQLYVAPVMHRAGIGRALLTAMRRESALEFWCFAHNVRGLAFYRSFAAVEIDRELGPENEEGLPAIKLRVERLE